VSQGFIPSRPAHDPYAGGGQAPVPQFSGWNGKFGLFSTLYALNGYDKYHLLLMANVSSP
jgi:hypothetical protein